MQTENLLNRHWKEVPIKLADSIGFVARTNGFDLEKADGTFDEIRFAIIDATTDNPKETMTLTPAGWSPVILRTLALNPNDVSLEGSLSDFDLTDDTIEFVDSNGDVEGTLDFSKYLVTAAVNAAWDIEISQDWNLLSTIKQNADWISFDNSGSNLTSTNVEAAIKEVNTKVSNGATPRQDDFVAAVWQTTFTLSNAAVWQASIFRNWILLAKACLSVSGTTATYDPAQNWSNAMVAWDMSSTRAKIPLTPVSGRMSIVITNDSTTDSIRVWGNTVSATSWTLVKPGQTMAFSISDNLYWIRAWTNDVVISYNEFN